MVSLLLRNFTSSVQELCTPLHSFEGMHLQGSEKMRLPMCQHSHPRYCPSPPSPHRTSWELVKLRGRSRGLSTLTSSFTPPVGSQIERTTDGAGSIKESEVVRLTKRQPFEIKSPGKVSSSYARTPQSLARPTSLTRVPICGSSSGTQGWQQ